ncbi:restriction endonuclease subunit S [Tautonia sp. JC769]|uniref:restriction endonuclease subunit S n=1 Tax=Tautonia sp. JC769 TaxID=3232135 RepID=UPI00345880BB
MKKAMRDTAIPEGFKLTEVGIIPEDWDITTVGAEFSIQLGKMLDAEKNTGVRKPYLGNRAIQWGRIDLSDISEVPLTPSDLSRFRLRNGDLLVCEGGEVGRAAIWQDQTDECYYQKALHRLRPLRGYSVNLLAYILHKMSANGFLLNFVTQTSIAHLPKDKFQTVPIPAPPKAEQEAIAEALSDADASIESLEQIITKKRQLKQGAMQELLTGKHRLPGFEKRRGRKLTELGELPNDWNISTVGDQFSIQLGKMLDAEKNVGVAKPFLGNRAVQWGHFDLGDIGLIRLSQTDMLRFRLRNGDLLVCEGGEIGRAAIWDSPIEECYYQKALHRLRPKQGYSVSLMLNMLNWLAKRGVLLNFVTQTSIAHLPKDKFETVPLPVPSPLEQEAIASILSAMDAEIDALHDKLTKTRQLKQAMMQELLTGRVRLV